jgi:GNAT superfamily N-acetyltransferase
LNEKIRQTEGILSPEDRRALFEWGENIFGVEDTLLQWRPKDWHFILEVDERPASHVGVLKHTISAGGEPVVVGGVGGVVTVPEMQGKGLAQRGMRHAAAFMCEELGVEFGFLFCLDRLVGFYESLGWQHVRETVEVEQESGPLIVSFNAMVLPCGAGGRAWPVGKIELRSLPW